MLYVYERRLGGRAVTAALNAGSRTVSLENIVPAAPPILEQACESGQPGPFGYAVWREMRRCDAGT